MRPRDEIARLSGYGFSQSIRHDGDTKWLAAGAAFLL
jgi:hypothetical protein